MKNSLFFFMLLNYISYSQSFKPVTSNSKVNLYCFEGVQGFRIDSITKSGNLEIINFHYQIRVESNKMCFNPYSPSWLGEKCIIDTLTKIAYFFNEIKDTLRISYSKSVGETWNFYKKGKKLLKAKVIGINMEKLPNGMLEPVKSIQIFNDSSGIDLWDNHKPTLKISENYGFTQLLDFFEMPNLEHGYNAEDIFKTYHYKLIPNRIIKLSDIYNYNEGDLFEYHIIDNYGPDDYHILEVIKKYSGTNYLLKNTYQNNTYIPPNRFSEIIVTYDTFAIKRDDILFDASKHLPGETVVKKNSEDRYIANAKGVGYVDSLYYVPRGYSAECTFHVKIDTCWQTPFENYHQESYLDYKEGYGYYIRYAPSIYGYMQPQEYMIYSKKGNKTTGTYIPLGIDNSVTKGKFFLYPNPSLNTIFIYSGSLEIQGYSLYSINGQILIDTSDYNKKDGIDISNLTNGLYFIKIQSQEGNSIIRVLKTENK